MNRLFLPMSFASFSLALLLQHAVSRQDSKEEVNTR